MAEFKPLILKLGKKAQAVVGDILRFPDHVRFDQQINIGTSADETPGNVKFTTDFFGKVNGIWKSLTRINFSDITQIELQTVVTTASTTFGLIPGMTLVPAAGKYKIEVELDVKMTGSFCVSEYGLYNNNTLIPGTFRAFGGDTPLGTISITKIFDCNGTDPINVRWRTLNSSRTVTCTSRLLMLTKIN